MGLHSGSEQSVFPRQDNLGGNLNWKPMPTELGGAHRAGRCSPPLTGAHTMQRPVGPHKAQGLEPSPPEPGWYRLQAGNRGGSWLGVAIALTGPFQSGALPPAPFNSQEGPWFSPGRTWGTCREAPYSSVRLQGTETQRPTPPVGYSPLLGGSNEGTKPLQGQDTLFCLSPLPHPRRPHRQRDKGRCSWDQEESGCRDRCLGDQGFLRDRALPTHSPH